MATTQQSQSQDGSLGRDLLYALRYYLRSRRGLFVLAGLAIAVGLALNWSWLAAAGIAPTLISVLPCLAMCALGLCMNRMTGGACASRPVADPDSSGRIESRSEYSDAALPDMQRGEARHDIQIER